MREPESEREKDRERGERGERGERKYTESTLERPTSTSSSTPSRRTAAERE